MNANRAIVALCIASLGCVSVLRAAPFVEMPNGNRIEGTAIRVTASGDVVLTTPQGQRTFTKGQYARAVADKPAEFDKARQAAAAKQYDEAEKALKEIVTKFQGLEWDHAARQVLGSEVYLAKGDAAASIAIYEELLRLSPDRKNSPDVVWAYRNALLAGKQYDKLTPALTEMISSGNRADAARAYVMRGDIKWAQQKVEPAALDFLRAAMLFESEEAVQPDALFKAAQALSKLNDPKAAQLMARLKEKFPTHPNAARDPSK